MIRSERKAWKEITIMMHRKSTLSEALKTIMLDSLFWTSELGLSKGSGKTYSQPASTGSPKGNSGGKYSGKKGAKGKGKMRTTWNDNVQAYAGKHWANYGTPAWQVKGAKTAKGAKGKKGTPAAPIGKGYPQKNNQNSWPKTDKNGMVFCMSYHYRDNCPGSCNRSHCCPQCGQWHSYCNNH